MFTKNKYAPKLIPGTDLADLTNMEDEFIFWACERALALTEELADEVDEIDEDEYADIINGVVNDPEFQAFVEKKWGIVDIAMLRTIKQAMLQVYLNFRSDPELKSPRHR